MLSFYTREKTESWYLATGNSPSIQPVSRFPEIETPPELLNFKVKLNFVVFLKNRSLPITLQVYKCITCDDDIFAVKVVKMEPQYTETQEVRLRMFSSKPI